MTTATSRLHPTYARMPVTIFEHMSGLARELGAINLGQGFPDGAPPQALLEALARASAERSHQYPPMAGFPELRKAVAGFYERTQGLELTPENVIVTSGATEAVASAILTVVSQGDEVLLFAPAYDAYAPLVRRAGGVPVFLALQAPDWRYERSAIEAAITPRTRALVLNDPLNPTGTVASPEDLAMIAGVCRTHDLFAICDEVWENVRFDGRAHASLLAQPGMAERALKIGSAGKIFGATGWKVGWIVGAPEVAAVVARAHQFLTFTTPPMLQFAVAEALDEAAIAKACTASWEQTRAVLLEGLDREGFVTLPSAATWFSCIDLPASGIPLDDRTFSERAVREALVTSIPLSSLWEGDHTPTHIARLCHCKPAPMLEDAISRLARWRDGLR
ncbi:aminotransferase class I/II-fold pyridoxal phosphate-dependent enzyme [Novosphingobium taihuense]|uniref:aspartate transaminase n=1 Tax=Novosphingobium taihuense TaxID=260085 RepID=A0A7W7AED9_9SPHN|nr:aminotransferase class I/II-fold pyridoxal phosphate-dependent enzyme [Novosphingobium taihuense]MBB4615366.1 aspartate/methionine/tyrosine aminotransferase [Novosphingobium taihuense]TWH82181.1 aspartate/methionine/tyrosine aminotransferase [Novosphingobium taihuense]